MTSSEAIHADIRQIESERDSTAADLSHREQAWPNVLLSGDDKKAERAEAEMAKLRRALQRADLRLPILREEHAAAVAAEQAAALAERQAEASRTVDEILERAETEYRIKAQELAAFVRDWAEAQRIAVSVGVAGPEERLRLKESSPARPAQIETTSYECFMDENGRETSEEFSRTESGFLTTDPRYRREKVSRTRERVIAREVPAQAIQLPPLAALVNLPGLAATDADHWRGDGLTDVPRNPAVAFGRFAA